MKLDGTETPMERVRTGMRVVDTDGEVVGRVHDMAMGEPDAVVPDANLADASPVPPEHRSRLLRTGYIEVTPGLFKHNLFAGADEIADVDDDGVHLAIPAARMVG